MAPAFAPDLRTTLRAARPDWRENVLQAVEEKLCRVGISTVPDLVIALHNETLNETLHGFGEKRFTSVTLEALQACTMGIIVQQPMPLERRIEDWRSSAVDFGPRRRPYNVKRRFRQRAPRIHWTSIVAARRLASQVVESEEDRGDEELHIRYRDGNFQEESGHGVFQGVFAGLRGAFQSSSNSVEYNRYMDTLDDLSSDDDSLPSYRKISADAEQTLVIASATLQPELDYEELEVGSEASQRFDSDVYNGLELRDDESVISIESEAQVQTWPCNECGGLLPGDAPIAPDGHRYCLHCWVRWEAKIQALEAKTPELEDEEEAEVLDWLRKWRASQQKNAQLALEAEVREQVAAELSIQPSLLSAALVSDIHMGPCAAVPADLQPCAAAPIHSKSSPAAAPSFSPIPALSRSSAAGVPAPAPLLSALPALNRSPEPGRSPLQRASSHEAASDPAASFDGQASSSSALSPRPSDMRNARFPAEHDTLSDTVSAGNRCDLTSEHTSLGSRSREPTLTPTWRGRSFNAPLERLEQGSLGSLTDEISCGSTLEIQPNVSPHFVKQESVQIIEQVGIRVRFFYASPLLLGNRPLALDIRSDSEAICAAEGVKTEVRVATVEHLREALLSRAGPSILHISAHCVLVGGVSSIILEDTGSAAHPMDATDFAAVGPWINIGLLVLLTCNSESFARTLVQVCGLRHAVCCSATVLDRTAQLFCRTFYQALGAGLHLKSSFEVAKGAVRTSPDQRLRVEHNKFLLLGVSLDNADATGDEWAPTPVSSCPEPRPAWPQWPQVEDYIGRESLALRISTVFEQRRVVCLWGAPGTGKTAFCTEFCRHFSTPGGRRFSGGAFLVDCAHALDHKIGNPSDVFAWAVLSELQQRGCAAIDDSPSSAASSSSHSSPRVALRNAVRQLDKAGQWLIVVEGFPRSPGKIRTDSPTSGDEDTLDTAVHTLLADLLQVSRHLCIVLTAQMPPRGYWATLGPSKVVEAQIPPLTPEDTARLLARRARRPFFRHDFDAGRSSGEVLSQGPMQLNNELISLLSASPLGQVLSGNPGRIVRAAAEVHADLQSLLQHPWLPGTAQSSGVNHHYKQVSVISSQLEVLSDPEH